MFLARAWVGGRKSFHATAADEVLEELRLDDAADDLEVVRARFKASNLPMPCADTAAPMSWPR
ncbi:MAG: hypothetical protein HY721_22235 [Planctomycetes bacterium]|nr:hypothetical protein [Planctomycetota bacterium]